MSGTIYFPYLELNPEGDICKNLDCEGECLNPFSCSAVRTSTKEACSSKAYADFTETDNK